MFDFWNFQQWFAPPAVGRFNCQLPGCRPEATQHAPNSPRLRRSIPARAVTPQYTFQVLGHLLLTLSCGKFAVPLSEYFSANFQHCGHHRPAQTEKPTPDSTARSTAATISFICFVLPWQPLRHIINTDILRHYCTRVSIRLKFWLFAGSVWENAVGGRNCRENRSFLIWFSPAFPEFGVT